jgi:hypothetical protein
MDNLTLEFFGWPPRRWRFAGLRPYGFLVVLIPFQNQIRSLWAEVAPTVLEHR